MSLASCAFVGTSSITDPSAGISLSKGRRLHHLGLQCSLLRHVSSQSMQHRLYVCNAAADGDEVPNWDEEMSIFKKRTMKPSQLAALRTWEENKVDLGTVLFCKDSIAIIEGLNNDADVGTALSFASGARGTMLWRRSDNLVYALVCGGAALVTPGDRVECRVRGILQLADESEGASTRREYELTTVPVGPELVGQVVDFLGRPYTPSPTAGEPKITKQPPLKTAHQLPMLNSQPDMDSREQINQDLFTGVKALDVLTPLGKGQALQVSGPQGSGKTQLLVDTVLGQRYTDVVCVFAAVGGTAEQLQRTLDGLNALGAMEYTTVVVADEGRPLGEQYAALLTACSIAEAVRDSGGHSLVVLNDISAMVRMWENITEVLVDLGKGELKVDKDAVAELAEQSMPSSDISSVSSLDISLTSLEGSTDSEGGNTSDVPDGMVEYEGMLVSVAAAQRRQFFSSLIQRAAKMHRRLGGGSMTSLMVVPGVPARGETRKAREKILKYKHLSEEQKNKLLKALEAKEAKEAAGEGSYHPGPRELRTEVVEEFMSISDGQIVLKGPKDPETGAFTVDPQLSISRIGTRAYPPALATLAPQVRFDLAQAADAKKYASDTEDSPAAAKAKRRADAVVAALPQPLRSYCTLSEQVVHLIALEKGLLDDLPVGKVQIKLAEIIALVRKECRLSLKEIETTRRLTATAQKSIEDAMMAACRM